MSGGDFVAQELMNLLIKYCKKNGNLPKSLQEADLANIEANLNSQKMLLSFLQNIQGKELRVLLEQLNIMEEAEKGNISMKDNTKEVLNFIDDIKQKCLKGEELEACIELTQQVINPFKKTSSIFDNLVNNPEEREKEYQLLEESEVQDLPEYLQKFKMRQMEAKKELEKNREKMISLMNKDLLTNSKIDTENKKETPNSSYQTSITQSVNYFLNEVSFLNSEKKRLKKVRFRIFQNICKNSRCAKWKQRRNWKKIEKK
eukprot:TRINITY_DN22274_c0_g1_i1.p1 TRINITY_DN22274_c0_g1~~TRINITY_DN22274_c0_g1_i1.p1  ORF type:complete len:269 (+),score=81.89 TRINITY_DN22274_c0_g1_i1:32-808(+)